MFDRDILLKLIEKGDVLTSVPGKNLKEIYSYVADHVSLPNGIESDFLVTELLEREKLLSTAVGKGIAIPHARRPLVKNPEESRIIVCFLDDEIDMNAPDAHRVFCMFIILSDSSQTHIKALSGLAKLLRNEKFSEDLLMKPEKGYIVDALTRIKID